MRVGFCLRRNNDNANLNNANLNANFNDNANLNVNIMEGKVKKARNFRNYKVWQDAVEYATKVYKVTAEMPWLTMLTLVTTRANKQA